MLLGRAGGIKSWGRTASLSEGLEGPGGTGLETMVIIEASSAVAATLLLSSAAACSDGGRSLEVLADRGSIRMSSTVEVGTWASSVGDTSDCRRDRVVVSIF